MKVFELFVAVILAGVMLLMSLVTCGRDLERGSTDIESKGKEIVRVGSREVIRNLKPSTSGLGINF